MPVDVAEDSLELMIELLEAGAPTPTSYPYPSLKRTGRLDRRTFRSIILENPYLRATIVPELGGRILRLEDKRSQTDVWPFNPTLTLVDGGLRGADCLAGLQVLTGFDARLNSMGAVSNSPDFTDEESDPAGIWWGELCGDGISVNCRYSLPAEEAFLEVEVRAFNRNLTPVAYNGGLSFGLKDGSWRAMGQNWLWSDATSELLVASSDFLLDFAERNAVHRFDHLRYLAPRQLDAWSVRIYPSSIGRTLRNANSSVAVGWDLEELAIQATTSASGSKIVIRTQDDATMELPTDLFPEHRTSISLESLGGEIAELVILDSTRTELVRASQLPETSDLTRSADESSAGNYCSDADNGETLSRSAFDIRQRHLAHLLLAYRHLAAKNYALAASSIEQSLLFNAEDHLAWWLKAIAERLAGGEGEERPELLNAHFLAPLEPALRAESYLSSPSQSKEKAAVLTPLAEIPEAFVEVACLLLEANLLEEAAKWLDEAIRHEDLPMLRYLLAYAYLKGSRMDVQAAEQVQMAVRPEATPPYPWRTIEIRALNELAQRFPADSSLKRFINLLA
jgi:tetratricopeptide (TPR) repeat protein